jgi:cytochrome oxidase Cu insertion factor (SCO1/SenC/PrrC family)
MQRRGRLQLLGLTALFFGPLLLAFWLYYAGGWRPARQSNAGELVQPAQLLPPATGLLRLDGQAAVVDPLRDHWSLVYVGAGNCDADCRAALVTMRQTRLALANEATRVERVFFATGECCDREYLEREHPGLQVLRADSAAATALLAPFAAAAPNGQAQSLFVVDPLGNLMMRHDASAPSRGLLSDLKKLLKLSHIG